MGSPVCNSPYGLCGRKATFEEEEEEEEEILVSIPFQAAPLPVQS